MAIYHKQCEEIIAAFKRGLIQEETARRQLQFVEELAYARYPNAEPDGDITYCVATAFDEIERVNKSLDTD